MVAVPFCRCRVLYIGSAVPTITKDGLQGIQQPLRERYPIGGNADTKGIDSWLSVWSNGLLLEYVDGDQKTETAFHPISSLHYCAAVRYVNVTGYAIEGGGERFLPLDSPFANNDDSSQHPPIFAAIFRRTTGIKVLECHAFICTNAKAANALVRCCFHAYAESMYIKLEERLPVLKSIKEASRSASPPSEPLPSEVEEITAVEDSKELEQQRWSERAIGKEAWERRQQSGEYDTASISSSIAKRLRNRKKDNGRTNLDQALVPYSNGIDSFPQRAAGNDFGMVYGDSSGETPYSSVMYPGKLQPQLRGGSLPLPHMVPTHPFMRPPPSLVPFPSTPPAPHLLPPMHRFIPMMRVPPPNFGMPPHFTTGIYPIPPLHYGMLPSRFMGPYGPIPPPMGRPRTPPDGPIITGPESVYGTIPRRPAYEEPIYMPGNSPHMPPQASYQPGHYLTDQYDAYYDSLKRQRSPHQNNKGSAGAESQTSSRRALATSENDESSQFWDSYEASIYRKPHLNEKAFSATIRSMPTATNTKSAPPTNHNHTRTISTNHPCAPTTATATTTGTLGIGAGGIRERADIVVGRPETPPADYDIAFDEMHISSSNTNNNKQQHTTAVFY